MTASNERAVDIPLPNALAPEDRILGVLGRGSEGTAYLVADGASSGHRVLKVFHKPIPTYLSAGLRGYARHVRANPFGLFPIELIDDGDAVFALTYRYEPLHRVHWRLTSFPSVPRTSFGSFCRMQGFLVSNVGIGIADASAAQFMIDAAGQFHLVDYGVALELADDPRSLDRGHLGYAFATMLAEACHLNLRCCVERRVGYRYDAPCSYCASTALDGLGERLPWVREILDRVRSSDASIFRDGEFYAELGATFPSHLRWPRLLIALSRALWRTGEIRADRVRRLAR